MILHAEQRQIPVSQPLQRVVVQVHMRQFDFALRKRIRIDGKIMIVRGDLNFSGMQLLHRMISPVMTELKLVSFPA